MCQYCTQDTKNSYFLRSCFKLTWNGTSKVRADGHLTIASLMQPVSPPGRLFKRFECENSMVANNIVDCHASGELVSLLYCQPRRKCFSQQCCALFCLDKHHLLFFLTILTFTQIALWSSLIFTQLSRLRKVACQSEITPHPPPLRTRFNCHIKVKEW